MAIEEGELASWVPEKQSRLGPVCFLNEEEKKNEESSPER